MYPQSSFSNHKGHIKGELFLFLIISPWSSSSESIDSILPKRAFQSNDGSPLKEKNCEEIRWGQHLFIKYIPSIGEQVFVETFPTAGSSSICCLVFWPNWSWGDRESRTLGHPLLSVVDTLTSYCARIRPTHGCFGVFKLGAVAFFFKGVLGPWNNCLEFDTVENELDGDKEMKVLILLSILSTTKK